MEHLLKVQLEQRDIGPWQVWMRPFYLLDSAKKRRARELLSGKPVQSRYSLSAWDILKFPFVLAATGWSTIPGGVFLRLGTSPAWLVIGGTLGLVFAALGTLSKVVASLDSSCSDPAASTSTSKGRGIPTSTTAPEAPRVRPPRFFATPTTLLREYQPGEAQGPQLLATLDRGRLRNSDEFVAHEPFGNSVVLVTDRRLLCVRRRHQTTGRNAWQQEGRVDATVAGTEPQVVWEVALRDIVKVTLSTDGAGSANHGAAVSVVYLPKTDADYVDGGVLGGFVMLRKTIECRRLKRAKAIAAHIDRQRQTMQPLTIR